MEKYNLFKISYKNCTNTGCCAPHDDDDDDDEVVKVKKKNAMEENKGCFFLSDLLSLTPIVKR